METARSQAVTFPQKTVLCTSIVLAMLSGMAALAHQMLWTRRLVDLLGASSLTFSKVVGAFFLGLAAGAALAAVRSGPVRRPWLWVAAAELSVAVLALPVLLTPHVAELLYQMPQVGAWLKQLIPFLFITPPAVAMGFVVPWMIRASSLSLPAMKDASIWLYAANTFGGVLGIIGALLVALPALGLTGAGLAVCGANVMVALAALSLDRHPAFNNKLTVKSFGGENPASPSKKTATTPLSSRAFGIQHSFHWLAFGSGFLVLTMEVVLQHQFAQVTINSLFSSGTVLAWGLLSLSAGSAFAPWLARRRMAGTHRFRWVLLGSAAMCLCQPFLFTTLRNGVDILPYELTALPYTWEVTKLAMVALCPLFAVVGLLFPLLLGEAASGSPVETGRRVALLLAWNGLGGWLGSEFGQIFLAPYFGLWQSLVLIGLAYAVLAACLPEKSKSPSARMAKNDSAGFSKFRVAVASILVAGSIVWVAYVFAGELPQVTLNPGEHLAALQVGREGVVATVECAPGDWRMLFNNSYTLGGSKARSNQERESHLPILLHGHAHTVAIMGVATGGTLAGAAQHPGIERIDAAELSPLVLKQSQEFFGPYSHDVYHDPRVHIFSEDARWMIATHDQAYDVIVGDLYLPWRTGEARLFSREHFQAIRRALKPDGVYCQWLPLFQLTRPQFDAIARTFQQVFPDAIVVRGDFYTELPILGLVGGRSLEQIDWQQVHQGCAELRATGLVTDPLSRHEEGVAMMVIGRLPAPDPGPINTLGNAWLEWDCAHNILGMTTPWFIGIPEAVFVRDVHRAAKNSIPQELRVAHEAGQFFLTLEITAKLKLPELQNFAAQVPQRLPAALRDDSGVEWQEWPMRIKPRLQHAAAN